MVEGSGDKVRAGRLVVWGRRAWDEWRNLKR